MDQRRTEPVSFAERPAAGAARSCRTRHRGPRGAAGAIGVGRQKLEGTAVAFAEHNDHVEAICPWGNRLRCYEPDAARFGRVALGVPYVEFDVPVGSAARICAFYPEIMGMPSELRNGDGTVAAVKTGRDQHLLFRETDRPQGDYDGHHVQMYITDFPALTASCWRAI